MKLFCLVALLLCLITVGLTASEQDYAMTASQSQAFEVHLDEPVKGNGLLDVSIESFTGKNPKRITQIADRVELWLGQRRLASLNKGDQGVVEEKTRRIFVFSGISLPHGYYIVSARAYSPAVFYGRNKWHEERFQVGIHPGKTSRVYRKIKFFHW